jgi:hypothetical protein
VLAQPVPASWAIALELALDSGADPRLGQVKERHLGAAKARESEPLAALRAPETRLSAAE